ncbi:MAG: ABC transporter ATP-binding protein [bacterium]
MILRVENLHKQFGGVHAVRGVDLGVAARRLHAIIGPNGAGKTTLAAQLAGAIHPDRGAIHFDGADITRMSAHKRARLGLARSFQITSVIAPMTLLENVMLSVQSLRGHSFRFWSPVARDRDMRAQAMQVLADVGLGRRAHVVAATASHGEQRRLECAMALALRPKLLLLDEPMAGMSAEESASMIALLRGLKRDTAILLIEHDMDAVFTLADEVSVLVNGSIIATGTTAQIRANAAVQRAYLGEGDGEFANANDGDGDGDNDNESNDDGEV